MLEIEITSSPDKEMIGTHTFYKNLVRIGGQYGDLLVSDPELRRLHIQFEVTNEGLWIHKDSKVEHFLLNSKKTLGKKLLKIKDVIGIGNTNIKIRLFEYTPIVSKKKKIRSNLELIMGSATDANAETSPKIESEKNISSLHEIVSFMEEDLDKLS